MIIVFSSLLWLLRFAMGACAFSFFNRVICRLPNRESVVRGRSYCLSCGKSLTVKELIPCISYLWQRGRCRGCGERISGRYFLVELAGGLLFVFCGAYFGYGEGGILPPKGLLAFAYLGILTMVAFIDWDTRIIYNRFHIGIALLGIISLWLFPEHTLTDRMIGAVVISFPMLILALIVEGAFGGGDIKLMAASGFLLGWRGITAAMFMGLLAGGAYCTWMLAGKKLARKHSIAFGPFLALGLGIGFFWGDELAAWYLPFL
ncbi:prepilin peptidase [bacterium 1xD42-62]|uniref:Prepilin peptidase n=2 Tax=Parablautia muri TaxID=2320879 RepID=A0A9X5BI82_9FIRM|nr:prepilin peptidase [Parablautia muri]